MKRSRLFLAFVVAMSLIAAPSFAAVKAGAKCAKAGATSTTGGKKHTCVKSGTKLVWNKGVAVKATANSDIKPVAPTSTPTPIPTVTPDKSLIYAPPSEASDDLELCKVKEDNNDRRNMQMALATGFPRGVPLTQRSGTVKWALIPIDFSDLPGEKNFRPRVDDQMKLLSEWFSIVSEGKFKVEWVVLDRWATLPGKSTDYVIPLSVNLNNAANGPKLFKDAMNAADPIFDFTNIQTVNFILPNGQTVIGEGSQGFPWDEAVRSYVSKEGPISSYSIPGAFFDVPGRTYWSYWAHEFGHAAGIPHVGASRGVTPPFNPWDLMGGQDGPSRELSGWLRFLADWMPEERVYCKTAANLKNVELTLVPLSGSEKGLKLVVIPVSKTKAILIESRRVTKFSCTTRPARNGPLVYTYDATLGHNQDFLVPEYLPNKMEQTTTNCVTAPTVNAVFSEGERITIDGVTIEVVASSNFDKLIISKKP